MSTGSTGSAPGLRLSTLGRLELEAESGARFDLARRPTRTAVLIYLGCERITTRERVLGVFWPDRPPRRGRHALNQTLHVLRKELEGEWLEVQGEQMRVLPTLTTDVAAFERAVKTERWEEALELYRGPFLDGFYLVDTNEFERWVARSRRRLAELHYEAHRRRVAGLDEGRGLAAAREWMRAYPDLEEPRMEYIRRLGLTGRGDEALREWDRFQDRIEAEGFPGPSPAWERLGAQLRQPGAGVSGGDPSRSAGGGTEPWRGPSPHGPRLVRIIDGEEAESFRLPMGSTLIGREEGRLTFPEDRNMSAVHALITVEEHGSWGEDGSSSSGEPVYRCTVQDRGSRNGVYLRIREERPLQNGDMFAAGRQLFRFEARPEGT